MDVIYFAQEKDDGWMCENCIAFDKYEGNGCTALNEYFGDKDSFCVDNRLRYVEVEKQQATHHALVTEEEIISVAKVSEGLDLPAEQIAELVEQPVLPILQPLKPLEQFVKNDLGGVKADGGKVRPTLLLKSMPNAIKEILDVLEIGAKKYSADNWKKVELERYEDAVLRHLVLEYLSGEKFDKETNKHTLAHAACCILFMLELELTKNK